MGGLALFSLSVEMFGLVEGNSVPVPVPVPVLASKLVEAT
jgi:hypothetical protein